MRGPTWRAGIAPHLRTLKLASCFVLARHCRLTISAAFTNMTRFVQRVVNLAQRAVSEDPRWTRAVRDQTGRLQ